MNKEELLAEMATKLVKVSESVKIEDAGKAAEGCTWYLISIYEEVAPDVLRRRNVHFYVFDEGKPTEKAYYMDRKPWAVDVAV